MKRALFTQWKLGALILLTAAAAVGCRRSAAATDPANNKPPLGIDDSSSPLPHDPGIVHSDALRRTQLLTMLNKSSLPLFDPSNVGRSEAEARLAFAKTFSPDYLPKELRNKLKIAQTSCHTFGCSVDVTYPDWATFAALDRAILSQRADHPASPFSSFPGARYRTGRVKIENKIVATWILAFRVREPGKADGPNGKDVP